MNFIKFLKDKIVLIVFWILSFSIFDLIITLEPQINISFSTFIYANLLSIFIMIGYLLISYSHQKRWNNSLEVLKRDTTKELTTNLHQEKYEEAVISDIIANFRQELTELNESKHSQEEFIETWVHDIKVPLSAIKLILEKNDLNEVKEQTNFELSHMNHLVEQILYYSRLNNFANDYLIRQTDLETVINNSLRNNMNTFITKKIAVDIETNNLSVLTDEKWLEFILNQIISNAVKYSFENGKISIKATEKNGSVTLSISDNGIGIVSEDINRVFEKGFTGKNGRDSSSKSTGLGLYLAHQMSAKLGQELIVDSEYRNGTTVKIIFPALAYFKQK